MIKRLLPVFIGIILLGKLSATAQIKPYMAVINTGDHVFKGILYQVTTDSIGLEKDQDIVYYSAAAIKEIKLKELKRGFRYKKYQSYDAYTQKNYEKFTNKMVPVRKWGEKDPTLEEQLSCRIITSFYNTAINGVFASLGLMNSSLNTYKVNYDTNIYKANAKSLASHSIVYQTGANQSNELQAFNTTQGAK